MHRLVKVAGCVLVVLLLAVVAMLALGARLPETHMVSASVIVEAPQGKVWSLLEDLGAQPTWRTGLKSIEPLADRDGHRCWMETQRRMRMPLCEEITAAPVTRVVAIADPGMSFGGTWTYTLTALTPEQTSVSITENGTTGPALWRFLGHYVYHEDTAIRQYERDLKVAAEKQKE